MVTIERMDDGKLLVKNRRQSAVVADEKQAKSTLTTWGHTHLSIAKALDEMKIAEGSKEVDTRWQIRRAGETTPGEPPAASLTRRARTRSQSTQEETHEVSEGQTVDEAPENELAVEMKEVAEPSKPRSRSRKSRNLEPAAPPAPDAETTLDGSEQAAEMARCESAEPVAVEETGVEPSTRKSTRKRAAPSRALKGPTDALPPPPVGEIDAAEPGVTNPSLESPYGATEKTPEATSDDNEIDSTPGALPKAKAGRNRKKSTPAQPTAGETADTPLLQAQRAFQTGAALLREMEKEVLPFARGPWTDLREQAERILAALQGKKSRS